MNHDPPETVHGGNYGGVPDGDASCSFAGKHRSLHRFMRSEVWRLRPRREGRRSVAPCPKARTPRQTGGGPSWTTYQNQPNGQAGTLGEAPRECCGGNCCAENEKCCNGSCIPDTQCCGDCPSGQSCCGEGLVCGGGTRSCETCCGPQHTCQFDNQCGTSNGVSCGTSGDESQIGAHCGDNGVCCLGEDTVCEHDDECCGDMTCGGFVVASVCG